jgi:hypothetical protein
MPNLITLNAPSSRSSQLSWINSAYISPNSAIKSREVKEINGRGFL